MDNIEIKMIEVNSSNILRIGYNPEHRILAIHFKGRFPEPSNAYHYRAVPLDIFVDLMKADSKGAYLAANIKGKYEFTHWSSALSSENLADKLLDENKAEKNE